MSSPEEKLDVLVAIAEAWKHDPGNYIGDLFYRISRIGDHSIYYASNESMIEMCRDFVEQERLKKAG